MVPCGTISSVRSTQLTLRKDLTKPSSLPPYALALLLEQSIELVCRDET